MKSSLKLEEAAMFGLSIFLFSQTDFAWWWYPALILAPDISILAYAGGTKTGASVYNLYHHKAIALALMFFGWHFHYDWLYLAGIIIFGHSSMDRMLGYGLKYPDSFQHTHLGWFGKRKKG